MTSKSRWETEDWADIVIAYGADPDVISEYDFSPLRVKMVRNVLRLRGANGDRMFKKVAYSDTRLAFVHGVVEHVYHNGYPYVPRFIRNKFGDAYVLDHSGQYYMTDWLPGRELELRKPQQLEQMAENLARFHKAAAGYQSSEPLFESKDDVSSQWRRYLAKLQSYRQAILQKHTPDEFDRLFLENWDYITEMIEDALFQLHHSPYPELIANARAAQQICHGSISRQNILADDERMYFVDFDHCHYGPVIQDLAALLHRYMPRCEWDEDVVLGIVDRYKEVRKLSNEELQVLNVYLQFPVRPVQVIEWYYEKLKNWDLDTYVDELLKSLDRDEDRDDFVDVMAEYYGIELYDGVSLQSANPAVPADGIANQEPLFTTAAGLAAQSLETDRAIEKHAHAEVPISWSAESSSVILDNEEDQREMNRPLFQSAQEKVRSKRKHRMVREKSPHAKGKHSRAKEQSTAEHSFGKEKKQGIWVDTQHIRRPVQSHDDISED
ncbi:CotS family spore coat protein [Fodinisporobacter ferrooxydans]|uniref:CotS family spore coat protein n=1 Tax=Fodinisporobacter ferrooxydans TaxID=2901836 RepID=A0ABY4CI23_9BACL|nr:CotS family spore coat protein [Alicyclobacillaceae bacterium MYW30-H2]